MKDIVDNIPTYQDMLEAHERIKTHHPAYARAHL